MLVNNFQLPGLARQTFAMGEGMPEFPSVSFGIENNPEFPGMTLEGFDQPDAATTGKSFADLLVDAIDGVSKQDKHAMNVGLDYALNRNNVDIHQVMIEQAKAESELHLMSAVTNKLASSYQTLMNMQI